MSGLVYKVPPLSRAQVRDAAEGFRAALGLTDVPFFPIMDVLERILDVSLDLIRFEIWEDSVCGSTEGLSLKDEDGIDRIVLPESVYLAGLQHEGRARFTAAHEAGHWNLHSQVALHRVAESQLRGAYESSEWQANRFAAELLMPDRMITRRDSVDELCSRFGVSGMAAQNRIKALSKEGKI